MIVKVFIRRRIKEGKESEVLNLVKQLRFKAMDHDGYISGETLINATDPMEVMVVSNWENIESWSKWKQSEGRAEIDAQLLGLQEKPTEYEPFVLSKYWLTVKEKGWKKRQVGVW